MMAKSERMRPAVFLDRDGVVIHEKKFLADPDGVELYAGVAEALLRLSEAGFALVVASNQSGVARGYFTEDTVRAVNARMLELLAEHAVVLDGVYYSPFHPEATVLEYRKDADCRKPNPGMLLRAADALNLALSASFLIGDKPSDLEAAENAGATGLLVRTGYGRESQASCPGALVFDDLPAAAEHILRMSDNSEVSES